MENFAQADLQDEDSGARTFAKYWYQYNWALVQFIEESDKNNKCSLSIECHEDVMILDDHDSITCKVELYQVKEKSMSPDMTAKSLAYSSKSSKSIFSKMINNINKKHLKDRIKRLALVSSKPFNLNVNFTDSTKLLHSFKWEDLEQKDKDILIESIQKDLNINEVPTFVEFIKGIDGYTEEVHSSIAFKKLSEYIEKITPSMASKPKIVFELLRSELIKIGTNTETYSLWSDFLERKTITAKQLNNIITSRSVPISGSSRFDDMWLSIKELEYFSSFNFKQKTKLKEEAKKYYYNKITDSSTIFTDISDITKSVLDNEDFNSDSEYITNIIGVISNNSDMVEYFDESEVKIAAAVMVEIIDFI